MGRNLDRGNFEKGIEKQQFNEKKKNSKADKIKKDTAKKLNKNLIKK